MNEPEIVVFADQAAGADRGRRPGRRVPGRCGRGPRASRLGDDGRIDPGRASTAGSRPRPLVNAVPWADIHVWWGDDRYVPRDHPLSNVKPFEDVLLDVSDAEEGTAGAGYAGVPCRPRTSTRSGRARRSAAGAGAAWCAAALADELRAAGLPEQDGWPVFDIMLLGIGPTGTSCRSSRAHRPSTLPSSRWRSRPRRTSSRTSNGSRSTRRSSASPGR